MTSTSREERRNPFVFLYSSGAITLLISAIIAMLCWVTYSRFKQVELDKVLDSALDAAAFIETVGRHDQRHWISYGHDSLALHSTLGQIVEATQVRGEGKRNQSVVMGTLQDSSVAYILNSFLPEQTNRNIKTSLLEDHQGILITSPLSSMENTPLALALRGQQGAELVTLPNGDMAFAGYTPVFIAEKVYGFVMYRPAGHITSDFLTIVMLGLGGILSIWGLSATTYFRSARLNRKLKRSRRMHQEAQAIGKVGHWEYIISTDSLHWSNEVESIFGLDGTKNSSNMEMLLEYIHPKEREAANRAYQDSLKNRTRFSLDCRIIQPAGLIKHVHVECTTDYDENGAPRQSFGIVQDVTDRIEAMNKLALSERRLNMAQQVAVIGNWEWDIATDEIYCSDQTLEIFQTTAAGLSSNEAFLSTVHPMDRKRVAEELALVEKGLKDFRLDHRIVLPDGTVRVVRQISVTIRNGNGVATKVVGTCQDITEQTENEEQLRAAKDTAEVANRVKDEFLANISHEIRTPLNGVLGMLQLLSSTRQDEEQSELTHVAINSCQHLITLLSDILDISTIESGKLTLSRRPFSPMELMQSVEEIFKDSAQAKDLQLSCVWNDSVYPSLIGDDVRLRQILFNLVGNAVKFTHEGNVTVKCTQIGGRGSIAELSFVVKDTGIGIPKPMQEQVFDAFRQVDGSHSREFGGVGLGLSIVDRLVSRMGGKLRLESEVGKGSSFSFAIPVGVDKREAPSSTIPTCKDKETPCMKVLVAEDDRVNQIAITRFLKKMGHDSVPVSNGQRALEAIKNEEFDAVLMDIQMPVMNGFEAIGILRHDPAYVKWANLPVIALTANAMSGDRQKCLDAGMDDYLAKPVDIQELEQALIRNVITNQTD